MKTIPKKAFRTFKPFHQHEQTLQEQPKGACLTDNRVRRAFDLFQHYYIVGKNALLNGVSPINFARVMFPLHFPVASVPPSVHIEFTNACNLKCTYCSSPLPHRNKGIMTENTFSRIEYDLKKLKVERVCIVGNGEALLHPNFVDYIQRLRSSTKYLSLTSNLNILSEEQAHAILKNINILNISVDGGDEISYESSRKGGNFKKLIANLKLLNEVKRNNRFNCTLNIRLMLRPSNLNDKLKHMKFWKEYADEVSIQYIVDIIEEDKDVFGLNCTYHTYPKCSMPFKILSIHWDGEIPLCTYTFVQAKNPDDYVLGNINKSGLREIWNHHLIKQYRKAHKQRDKKNMPLCNGCGGC